MEKQNQKLILDTMWEKDKLKFVMKCKARAVLFSPFTRKFGCKRCGHGYCIRDIVKSPDAGRIFKGCNSDELQKVQAVKTLPVLGAMTKKKAVANKTIITSTEVAAESKKKVGAEFEFGEEDDAISMEFLEEKLKKKFEADVVQISDTSDFGTGGFFSIIIVSTKFEGHGLLARDKMIKSAFEEKLKTIHISSQKSFTPPQWKKLGGRTQPSTPWTSLASTLSIRWRRWSSQMRRPSSTKMG